MKDPGLWQGSQPGGINDSALWLGWNTGLLNCGSGSWIGETGPSAWLKSSHTVCGPKGFWVSKANSKKKKKNLYTREEWTMSRHISLWAAAAPLLSIYMTMFQHGSIASSPWTFNSPMSQLFCSQAKHTSNPQNLIKNSTQGLKISKDIKSVMLHHCA